MNPLNAAAALMSRLTYAQKFLLLGFVLLAPAGSAIAADASVAGLSTTAAELDALVSRFVVG